MKALRTIVVVGNGIAGLTAADTLRAEGYDGALTLVGDERCPAYSRPALSKALLRDGEDLTAHELPRRPTGRPSCSASGPSVSTSSGGCSCWTTENGCRTTAW